MSKLNSMGAPKGNKNAAGNRGGGRKSAYQENADAELLREMFFGELSREEIQEKLRSGKYSLKDVFVSKGYSGSERVLLAVFNKTFPDEGERPAESGPDSAPAGSRKKEAPPQRAAPPRRKRTLP